MNTRIKWLIFVIPVIIICTGLLLYVFHLNGGFSTDSKDWGGFGGFMNPFVTLSNVCLFVIFSLLVYRYNTSVNRPILTFRTEKINPHDTYETWQIINLGSGAALNLIVSYKRERSKNWEEPSVKCYSIGKDGKVNLDWLNGSVDIIGVYYKDIYDNEYVAIVGDDISEVRTLGNYSEIVINGTKVNKSELEKLKTIRSVRINEARNQVLVTTTGQTTLPPPKEP